MDRYRFEWCLLSWSEVVFDINMIYWNSRWIVKYFYDQLFDTLLSLSDCLRTATHFRILLCNVLHVYGAIYCHGNGLKS